MAPPPLPPPPLTNALAQQDGKPAPPWARWLQQLWDTLPGAAGGAVSQAFSAFAQTSDNWTGSPASKTSGSFTSNGGSLLILAASSAYRDTSAGTIGFY